MWVGLYLVVFFMKSGSEWSLKFCQVMNGRVLYEIWSGSELSLVLVWIKFGRVLNEVFSGF